MRAALLLALTLAVLLVLAAALWPRAGARKSGLQGLAEEELLGAETPLERELGGIPAWDFGGRTAGTGTLD